MIFKTSFVLKQSWALGTLDQIGVVATHVSFQIVFKCERLGANSASEPFSRVTQHVQVQIGLLLKAHHAEGAPEEYFRGRAFVTFIWWHVLQGTLGWRGVLIREGFVSLKVRVQSRITVECCLTIYLFITKEFIFDGLLFHTMLQRSCTGVVRRYALRILKWFFLYFVFPYFENIFLYWSFFAEPCDFLLYIRS